jgi:hypothetical protein
MYTRNTPSDLIGATIRHSPDGEYFVAHESVKLIHSNLLVINQNSAVIEPPKKNSTRPWVKIQVEARRVVFLEASEPFVPDQHFTARHDTGSFVPVYFFK